MTNLNDTIIVAIIGALSTIIVPIVTWILTSRSKDKEKKVALESMQKEHEHELDKLILQHEHGMKTKEQELEFEIAKLQAEAENTKDLDFSSRLNQLAGDYISKEMNNPQSDISKQIKQASKQESKAFISKR